MLALHGKADTAEDHLAFGLERAPLRAVSSHTQMAVVTRPVWRLSMDGLGERQSDACMSRLT